MWIVYAHASRFILLHDQFTQRIRQQMYLIFLFFSSHAAIQVQFLLNKTTVDEGDFMAPLTIQFLLTPAHATFRFSITIALSVFSGSAAGTVHG